MNMAVAPALPTPPRLLLLCASLLVLRRVRRHAHAKDHVPLATRLVAISDCKRLVGPTPHPRLLGGERLTTDTYARFLSVCKWDAERASNLLQADLAWRAKYKPRGLKPSDMPNACRQRGWIVMTVPLNKGKCGARRDLSTAEAAEVTASTGTGATSSPHLASLSLRARFSSRIRNSWWPGRAGGVESPVVTPLHPPHNRPSLEQWRFTRSGMPITIFQARAWHPERCKHDERVRHVAYQMEHYIRRMPSRAGGRRVQRCCIILDMRGFRPKTLPHIKECIDVLRNHYPGRLGVACFINVPPYFYPVWKLVSPLLDEEILSKTFFLPTHIKDVDRAIAWLDAKPLPDPWVVAQYKDAEG